MQLAIRSPVENNDWLRAFFDESPMAIGFSRDGVMLDANPAYLRLFGYDTADELRGKSILEQIAPSQRLDIQSRVRARAQGGQPSDRYQTRGKRKDGTEFPFEVVMKRVLVAGGPMTIAFMSDTSERDAALQALQESEERFRTLSGAASEGVFVHADGRITSVNEAGEAMFGYPPGSMLGIPLMDLVAPDYRPTLVERLRRGADDTYEGFALRKDGAPFPVEVRGRTLAHRGGQTRVVALRDLTERKRIEGEQRALAERVRQAQKLESLSVMAGGVAHDFNNILTVICNEVGLARAEAHGAAAAHLDSVSLAAERAADLCRQMLAYAGKALLETETVSLNTLVSEMSSMLEASITKKATLVRELAADLPNLRGDPTQIRQVIMNLVLNASEALSNQQGTLRISTGAGIYDAAAFARTAIAGAMKAGPYVWLEVRDDGVGMDTSTVAQMFDPFFTTKFVGRGLGMAAVLGIVRGHEGAIDVESSPGLGTRIRVLFPASGGETPLYSRRPEVPIRGEGVVLLVDDEKNVRLSTQMLLKGLGFDVLVACDGVEALEVLKSATQRIDAVLLDLSMPRMDGIESLKEIRGVAPHVPVVLSSGYASVTRDVEPDAFLPKPYVAERLLTTLLQVMSQTPPPPRPIKKP